MSIAAPIIGALGLVTSAIGVGVEAASARREVQAQNAAAEYNAQVAARNAELENARAVDARVRGELEVQDYRRKVSKLVGQQRATFGASGAVVDTGSPLAVTEDTEATAELDALAIQRNAAREVWGHQVQSQNYSSEAGFLRASKRSPKQAYRTTLLTGGSRLLGQAFNYTQVFKKN